MFVKGIKENCLAFPYRYQVGLVPLIEKIVFLPLLCKIIINKMAMLSEFESELWILFHWYTCSFLGQYYTS